MRTSACRYLLVAAVTAFVTSLSTSAVQHASAAPDNTFGMAVLFAAVNADGSLARGSGVTATSNITAGQYQVTFDRDVGGCGYYATIGTANVSAFGATRLVQVAPPDASPPAMFVGTTTTDGTFINAAFHLLVFCPR